MDASLWSTALGLLAQQTNLDVVAHNIANINTVGYKRALTNFENLTSAQAQIVSPTATDIDPFAALGGVQATPKLVFSRGTFRATDSPLDLAIDGEGFFRVQRPDGTEAYTRDGTFGLDGQGRLTTISGYLVMPPITAPPENTGLVVKPNGEVYAEVGGKGNLQKIGDIDLARFSDPSSLSSIGGNLYEPTDNSGPAAIGAPGTDDRGAIRSGMLEMSNVDMAGEMVSLMLSQRAYQMNARTLELVDQMVQDATKLTG